MAGKKISVNKDDNNKSIRKQNKDKSKEHKKKPSWMFQESAEGNINKPSQWNGTTWYFCSPKEGGKCNLGKFLVHKTILCKSAEKGNAKGNKGAKLSVKQKEQKKVVIKEAVETIEGGYASE